MDQKTLDAFRILGLQPGASQEEMKNVYRKLANEYHPDKVASLGKELRDLALKKMKEINAAYQWLQKIYTQESHPYTRDRDAQSDGEQTNTDADNSEEKTTDSFTNGFKDFSNVDLIIEKNIDGQGEINRLRERVSKWASSIPHHDFSDLGSRMEILSAIYRPAYYVALDSQFESRTLKQTVEPETKIRVPDMVKDSPIDVWALPLQAVNQFKTCYKDYPIPETERIWDCPQCGRRGFVPCNGCGASGRLPCDDCNGHGKKRCGSCGGSGLNSCWDCGGKGTTKVYSGSYSHIVNCSRCYGKGATTCRSCMQGFTLCNTCSGQGAVTCPYCLGHQQISCPGCKGGGILRTILYIHHACGIKPDCKKVFNPKLRKDFLNKQLKIFSEKLNEFSTKQFEAICPEWTAAAFSTLRHDIVRAAAGALAFEAKAKEKKKTLHGGAFIARQKFAIFRIDISYVEYRCFDKTYELYVYGEKDDVWAKESPIHEIEQNRFIAAEEMFKEKKYTEAHELMLKTIAMSPANKKYAEFLKQILRKTKQQYIWGGVVGGTITIPILGTLLGVWMGHFLNAAYSTKIKTGKRRFFRALFYTIALDILIAALILACVATVDFKTIGSKLKNYGQKIIELCEGINQPSCESLSMKNFNSQISCRGEVWLQGNRIS